MPRGICIPGTIFLGNWPKISRPEKVQLRCRVARANGAIDGPYCSPTWPSVFGRRCEQKNTAVKLFLWKKYRSAQEINNEMTCQMVKMVAQYQLGPHVHCVNESPGGCAQFNFPSEAKGAVRAPWTPTATAESLQDGHPGRSVGAEINYTKCQHTGPNFETKISRSPALPCPTATCSRQSAPSSQNSRREDGPMSLPPEALELMSYDPLLGRCRKRRDSVQSLTRHRLQRADPKKAVCSWADISGRRPFRARTL
jgi:hypothetical protein